MSETWSSVTLTLCKTLSSATLAMCETWSWDVTQAMCDTWSNWSSMRLVMCVTWSSAETLALCATWSSGMALAMVHGWNMIIRYNTGHFCMTCVVMITDHLAVHVIISWSHVTRDMGLNRRGYLTLLIVAHLPGCVWRKTVICHKSDGSWYYIMFATYAWWIPCWRNIFLIVDQHVILHIQRYSTFLHLPTHCHTALSGVLVCFQAIWCDRLLTSFLISLVGNIQMVGCRQWLYSWWGDWCCLLTLITMD